MRNLDEEVPVRGFTDYSSLAEDTKFTKDEADQSTLQRVCAILKVSIAELDKWRAFDLTESELKLKQQIKAHKLAADILEPCLEAVEQALTTIDEKFKARNNVQ